MSDPNATTVAAALRLIGLLIDRLVEDKALSPESAVFLRDNLAILQK